MNKQLITLNNVTKVYNAALEKKPVTAVDGLSFTVESGGITGFVGPNGAGKTTSIKMILGLIKPSKGSVELMGKPSSKYEARESIAYISEQPYFYAHLSAIETLKFVCEMKKIPKNIRKNEIQRVLECVELSHRGKAKVKTFSKGMQQRLNMAQALLGSPQLIIMDEPMSGLDPLGRRLFRRIFKDLAASGVSIFFSTHIIEDIESLCDRVVVLSKGKLTYAGGVQELLDESTVGIEYRFSANQAKLLPDIYNEKECTVVKAPDGSITISVKNENEKIIEIIENGLIPVSINPLRRSLEDILYDKKDEK